MNKDLFQNDNITANSKLGFEFYGIFKDNEDDILISKLKDILNREITFSNVNYKLIEPDDNHAVITKDGKYNLIKTPMYSYFEALFILPNILNFLGELKETNNSYFYIKIGFNEDYLKLSDLNLLKFILTYNEKFILSKLGDITIDGNIEKLTDIKPKDLNGCNELIQKQINNLRFIDDDIYGIDFSALNLGFIKFKYAREIDYKKKWEEIIQCIKHTIITLNNATIYQDFDNDELGKIDKINTDFKSFSSAFGCYELFKEKYKSIKLTVDLSNDISSIDIIFPSIKEKLFNIIICNNIKQATINYDSDISKIQIKDIEMKKCYHLEGIDIIDSEIENSCLKNCDIYDTKITNSKIIKSNLFGYANCKDSKFKDCFISRNIKLTDCSVYGELGKMGGVMKGGSLKNTTILIDMADISNDVEKDNVNEIR